MSKYPNLYLVGAPKCGTTSMYHYLKSHSQIFFPEAKEPHHFGTDLGLRAKGFRKESADYLALYSEAGQARYRGDASVFYLYSEKAAERIARAAPEARIICLLRRPVDMMFSMYTFALRHGAETANSFEEALRLEANRKDGQAIPATVFIEEMLHYRGLSNYLPQLERYYQHFPKEQILVLLHDDLKNKPEPLFQQVADFLEVENEFQGMEFYTNRTKDIQFSASKVLNRKYPGLMATARKWLPDSLRQRLQFSKQLLAQQPEIPKSIAPQTRKLLLQETQAEVQALSQFLNRDLSHWFL